MNYSAIIRGTIYGFLSLLLTGTAYGQKFEDKDLKFNVSKITSPNVQLKQLEPITFQYIQNKGLKLPSGKQYGFLTAPLGLSSVLIKKSGQMYESGKNNMKVAKYDEVDLDRLIPIMVSAIKEQQAEIAELKSQISLLKQQAK